MRGKQLQHWRRQLRSRWPIVGTWWRRRAMKQLLRLGSGAALQVLFEYLIEEPNRQQRHFLLQQLQQLAHTGHQGAQQTLADYFWHEPDPNLAATLQATGFHYRQPDRQAAFLFLSSRWQEYQEWDWDQQWLRRAYETGTLAQRQRLTEHARQTGHLGWLQFATADRPVQQHQLARMGDLEWLTLHDLLLADQRWSELWRLALLAPPVWAAWCLQSLHQLGWLPATGTDRQHFQQLQMHLHHWQRQKDTSSIFIRCTGLLPDSPSGANRLWSSPQRLLHLGHSAAYLWAWLPAAATAAEPAPEQTNPDTIPLAPVSRALTPAVSGQTQPYIESNSTARQNDWLDWSPRLRRLLTLPPVPVPDATTSLAAFSPNRSRLAVAFVSSILRNSRLWIASAVTGQLAGEVRLQGRWTALTWLGDNELILADDSGQLVALDAQTGQQRPVFSVRAEAVLRSEEELIELTAVGETTASAPDTAPGVSSAASGDIWLLGRSDQRRLYVWSRRGWPIRLVPWSGFTDISCHSWVEPRQLLLTGHQDGMVRAWSPRTGQLRGQSRDPNAEAASGTILSGRSNSPSSAVRQLHWWPEAAWVVVGFADGRIALWSLADFTTWKPIHPGGTAFTTLTTVPTLRLLAAGFADGILRCWSLPHGRRIASLSVYRDAVADLILSPCGQFLVTTAISEPWARCFDLRGFQLSQTPTIQAQPADLAWLQTALTDVDLADAELHWQSFVYDLCRWHRRHDVQLAESDVQPSRSNNKTIQLGPYAIEIGVR